MGRLLSNTYTGACVNLLSHRLVLMYTRVLSREITRASHYVQRRSIRNIAKRKTEPESLKEKGLVLQLACNLPLATLEASVVEKRAKDRCNSAGDCRGKPVLIMHIGFFACFHAISLECSRFSKIATFIFMPL